MKLFKSLAIAAAMTMLFAANGVSAPASNLIPKVKGFDFLVDNSGSMMMKNNAGGLLTNNTTKLQTAKDALTRVNEKIPNLGYTSSLHTMTPADTVLPASSYDKSSMDKAIKSVKETQDVYGRYTTMGDSISKLSSEYNQLPRKAAVIIATDGHSNLGADPVAEVTALYNANPDICVHFISLADTAQGKKAIEEMSKIRKCSVVAEASDLAKSDAAAEQFVQDVFYDRGQGIIALRSVQFGFNSAKVDVPSSAVLDEVASMLKDNPRNVEISGHTCSIGSDDYNMKLSQRRADAVKEYLVRQGVPASSIDAVGKGESEPKYDNRTNNGRHLNRRAEIN